MKFQKPVLINISLSILAALLVIFLSSLGALKRVELAGLDFQFSLRQTLPFDKRIIIIEISDADIAAFGRWPWDRSYHAAMVKTLKELGARSVYFDIIFSEPSSEKEDALLEIALKESGNVYLPVAFEADFINSDNAFFPINRFVANTKAIGAINIYPDIDGVLRRVPLLFHVKDRRIEEVGLKIAVDYAGLNVKGIEDGKLVLEDQGMKKKHFIPLDEKNTFLINWTGKWKKTFKHYGFVDTLVAYKHKLEGKKPEIDLNDFKDSICLVGVTGLGLHDIKPVPLEPTYPGIGILANVVDNILNNRFLETVPVGVNILLIFLLALTTSFFITGARPFIEVLGLLAVGGAYFLFSYLLFLNGILLNYMHQLIGLLFAGTAIIISNFVRVGIERQNFLKMAVTDGLTGLHNIRYFKSLLETEILTVKNDPANKFSIVMSDVDHFKKFNDTYGHQVGDLVLKEVAGGMKKTVRASDLVARYGGEEMIALLRGTHLEGGLILAEKIRHAVETLEIKDEKNTYKVTISLGVAQYKPGDTVDSLIKRADDGLYEAKEGGRNRVCHLKDGALECSS